MATAAASGFSAEVCCIQRYLGVNMSGVDSAVPQPGSKPLAITFKLTADEYLEGQRIFLRHFASRYMRFNYKYPVPVGIYLLANAVLAFYLLSNIWLCLFLVAFGAYLILWKTVIWPWRVRKGFIKFTELASDRILAFTVEKISVQSIHSRNEIDWGLFTRFLETEGLFVLFGEPRILLSIPKRAFLGGETDLFRDLLKRKLPGVDRRGK
jgi:hypothetical protein